jgi:hypothetical protein
LASTSRDVLQPRLQDRLMAHGLRIAAWFAYGSGTVAAVGVPLLLGMYGVLFRSGLEDPAVYRLGGANDLCVLAQYALAVPIAVVLHRQTRATALRPSLTVTALGIGAMTGIVVLQAVLIAGLLPFEEQVVYVGLAMLVLVIWFVVTSRLGRRSGLLSGRITLMGLLGASYIGYPIWAFWLARQLRARALLVSSQP